MHQAHTDEYAIHSYRAWGRMGTNCGPGVRWLQPVSCKIFRRFTKPREGTYWDVPRAQHCGFGRGHGNCRGGRRGRMTSGEDYRGRTPKRANMLAILLPLTPASLTVVTERLTPSVATLLQGVLLN